MTAELLTTALLISGATARQWGPRGTSGLGFTKLPDAEIPKVGLTFATDGAGDEAASGFNLVDALNNTDHVKDVRASYIGEILCDQMVEAEDAEYLQFLVNEDEAITGEKRMYTLLDGSTFTDGNSRHVWSGIVIEPEKPEGVIEWTVSMTWTEECDVETFLFKVIKKSTDGTTIVVKSIPCPAGGETLICIVELEMGFADEDDPITPPSTVSPARRLTSVDLKDLDGIEYRANSKIEDRQLFLEYTEAADEEKEILHAQGIRLMNDDTVVMPSGRRLDVKTQVDVLVLYTAEAKMALGNVSDAQIESDIATAFQWSNDATENSEIPLTFNIAHTQQMYTIAVGTLFFWISPNALYHFKWPLEDQGASTVQTIGMIRVSSEVDSLRSTYNADLVLLVGYWEGTCGYGYYFTGYASAGFAIVVADCFNNHSHTHEMGHNLGCYHNPEDTSRVHDYAYGFRYCDRGDMSYRTIMSYSCPSGGAPRVNHFSNPCVEYNNLPTGDESHNNARVIEENMVQVAAFYDPDTCATAGSACTSGGDCCIGTCKDDVCGCTATGESCATDSECCSSMCTDGECVTANACGDPHLAGFRGQKFDFTGEEGAWYSMVYDGPCLSVNMRITAPVPETPAITYITGVGITLCDSMGVSHTIELTVDEPHVLESHCPESDGPCLADGALSLILDGARMTRPGQVVLGDGVSVSALNLPGPCRSFGFEKYWLAKAEESAPAVVSGRRLSTLPPIMAVPMSDWILSDAARTNPEECREYVEKALQNNTLFEHQTEYTSLQITSPVVALRITHGKIHQLAMRDPTDRFDLPDHTTFQQNVVFEQTRLGYDPQGVIGETVTPVLDAHGEAIMEGLDAIRGSESDYRVSGPFENDFTQLLASSG